VVLVHKLFCSFNKTLKEQKQLLSYCHLMSMDSPNESILQAAEEYQEKHGFHYYQI